MVGALPSGLVQRLWIPPGAVVLGGWQSSGSGLAILRSKLSKDSLQAAYRREQPRLGWTARPRTQVTPMGGFAPAPNSRLDPDAGLIFCAGGTTLTVDIGPAEGFQEIRALAFAVGEYLCSQRREPEVARFQRPEYPTLNNPPGSGDGWGRSCASWNSGGGGGGTRLTTTARLDEIMAHYGKQLTDSGWTLANGQSLSYAWTRRDTSGNFVELTLTARSRASNPDCVEVDMRINGRRP